MASGAGSMIGRLRSWFTPPPETRGYVDQILSAQLAAASGTGSIRDSAVYEACKHLIADCVSTAELEGDGADILQPRLGEIAASMVDTGQSAHELIVGQAGQLQMLPVEITNVQGGSEEASWILHRGAVGSDGYHDRREGAGWCPQLSPPTIQQNALERNAIPFGGEHDCHPPEEVRGPDDLRSGHETGATSRCRV